MVSQNFYMNELEAGTISYIIKLNITIFLHNFPYWSWPKFLSFELEAGTRINIQHGQTEVK